GLRLLNLDAGLHARDDVQVLDRPARVGRELFRLEGDGSPEVGRLPAELAPEVEVGRHDADDRVRLAVERDVLVDDGQAREATMPEAVAEDYDLVASFRVLVAGEGSPFGGTSAERGEDVGRDVHAV